MVMRRHRACSSARQRASQGACRARRRHRATRATSGRTSSSMRRSRTTKAELHGRRIEPRARRCLEPVPRFDLAGRDRVGKVNREHHWPHPYHFLYRHKPPLLTVEQASRMTIRVPAELRQHEPVIVNRDEVDETLWLSGTLMRARDRGRRAGCAPAIAGALAGGRAGSARRACSRPAVEASGARRPGYSAAGNAMPSLSWTCRGVVRSDALRRSSRVSR